RLLCLLEFLLPPKRRRQAEHSTPTIADKLRQLKFRKPSPLPHLLDNQMKFAPFLKEIQLFRSRYLPFAQPSLRYWKFNYLFHFLIQIAPALNWLFKLPLALASGIRAHKIPRPLPNLNKQFLPLRSSQKTFFARSRINSAFVRSQLP